MPEDLKYCSRLEKLNVASNHISRLPTYLSGCKSLRELDLSANMIEFLPKDMRGMKKISRIYLGKNRIRALPLDMANIFDSVQEASAAQRACEQRFRSSQHRPCFGRSTWIATH